MGPPPCKHFGLGSARAAGSIAPLCVPIRALCGSLLNCHHDLLSTLASTWGARASGSPWWGQREDVAGSDTEPLVPGTPHTATCPITRGRDLGVRRDSSAQHRLPTLVPVPCCHPGAGVGVPHPEDNPGRGDVLCHVPSWHRRSGRAPVLRCTAATPKPSLSLSPDPVSVTVAGRAVVRGLCRSPRAGAVPVPGPRTELLLAKSGSCHVPWAWLWHRVPTVGTLVLPGADAGLRLGSPTEPAAPVPQLGGDCFN